MISLRELKAQIARFRPLGDPLREVIVREPDEMDPREFASKVPSWLVLLRLGTDSEVFAGTSETRR